MYGFAGALVRYAPETNEVGKCKRIERKQNTKEEKSFHSLDVFDVLALIHN